MSLAPNTAGESSSDMTSSELTHVPVPSELHTNVFAKSSHFFTSSVSSSDDDERASKLRYTDENDVWSIEQRESSLPRVSIWIGAGDDSDVTGHGGWTWWGPSAIVNLGNARSINACTEEISSVMRLLDSQLLWGDAAVVAETQSCDWLEIEDAHLPG